jgi:hypothetical protein
MNNTSKAIILLISRLIVFSPFAVLIYYTNDWATNIAVFFAILLTAITAVYLTIELFIPAEYAIKTEISVIEHTQSAPYTVCLWVTVVIAGILSLAMIGQGMFWYGSLFALFALSQAMWPNYITKIDHVSKAAMMDQLTGLNK